MMQDEEILLPLAQAEAEQAVKCYHLLNSALFPNAVVMGLALGGFLLLWAFLFAIADGMPGWEKFVPAINAVRGVCVALTLICYLTSVQIGRKKNQVLNKLLPRCRREQINLLCGINASKTNQKLIELLPTVGERGEFVSRKSRRTLFLSVGATDLALPLAFLKAMEQIGDKNDLPSLKSLANLNVVSNLFGSSPISVENLPQIQEQARCTLDAVNARLAKETARDTLLRPADSSRPDTMLRSVAPMPDLSPQTLLRASQDPPAED